MELYLTNEALMVNQWRLTLVDEIWTLMNCICGTNQIFHHYTRQSRLIPPDFAFQLLTLPGGFRAHSRQS